MENLSRQELLELMDARVMWEETHVDEEGNEYAVGVGLEEDPYADLSAVSARIGLRTTVLYRDASKEDLTTDPRLAITPAEIRLRCRLCRESGKTRSCCGCEVFKRKRKAMRAGLKQDSMPLNPCAYCPLLDKECAGNPSYLKMVNELGGPVRTYKTAAPSQLYAVIGDDPELAIQTLTKVPKGAGVVIPLETAAEAQLAEACLERGIPVYIITSVPREKLPAKPGKAFDAVQKTGRVKVAPNTETRNQIIADLVVEVMDATLFNKKSVATLAAIRSLKDNR